LGTRRQEARAAWRKHAAASLRCLADLGCPARRACMTADMVRSAAPSVSTSVRLTPRTVVSAAVRRLR